MTVTKIFDQTVPYISGYSMRSRYIAESLTALGLDVKVIRSPVYSYEHPHEIINGVDYHSCGAINWDLARRMSLLKPFFVLRKLKKSLYASLDEKTKLIHAHSSVLNAMAGLEAARRRRIPFVYEIRALWEDAAVDQGKTSEDSLRYFLTRRAETAICRKADHITVICEGLKHDLIERGIPGGKITVVPNGVEVERFKPEHKDERLAESLGVKGKTVFGFIGTFFLFEGLELLIQAAEKITSFRDDVRFLIVGGGREEGRLKTMTEELGLQDKVILPGRIPHEMINKYYALIDVFVYPRISKRITELVTPLKPLEAMAMQKMIIGSSVGGIKELVLDGFNGVLFRTGDVDDLASKCLNVLEDSGRMGQMAQQARDYVIKQRNWLSICRRYLPVYQELGVKV